MADGVTLDELRDLFAGVPAEDNTWATTPCYTIPLAFEVAKRCDTTTESALRAILFDDTPVDEIPKTALMVIQLAAARYRTHRQMNNGGRGL